MESKRKIICLTPVKNEEWIIDKFLRCASLWADIIIIADQQSSDKTKEISQSFQKVIYIENKSNDFSEKNRQSLLINEARKIKGSKVLITLDADEIFTAESLNNSEWDLFKNAEPGTVFRFRFMNITPDFKYYWCPDYYMPWGFVDDGKQHLGKEIHSFRVPLNDISKNIFLKEIKVMHFQYTDWERMQSKHRWYQCWERVNNPDKSSIQIFRGYNHMYAIKKNELNPVPDEWFSYYLQNGIDLKDIKIESDYYWDRQVLDYFKKYGTAFFKRIDLWYINWKEVALKYGYTDLEDFRYPQNIMDRLVLFWLKKTQYNHKNILVRIIDKILVKIFKY